MQNIRLHGGPWHGRELAIQDGINHIHLIDPDPTALRPPASDDPVEIKVRKSTYSRVGRDQSNFEWDGYYE